MPRAGQLSRRRQQRHRVPAHRGVDPRALAHFEQVTEQPEAGDIGERMDAWKPSQPSARRIELRRAGDHLPILRVGDLLLLERGAVHADAQGLSENDRVAGLRLRVALDLARIDEADGHQPVDRLHGVDAVAAGDGNARALADRFAALKNPPDRLERHLVDRHRDERQREQRAFRPWRTRRRSHSSRRWRRSRTGRPRSA